MHEAHATQPALAVPRAYAANEPRELRERISAPLRDQLWCSNQPRPSNKKPNFEVGLTPGFSRGGAK
jgi:hypothetical protein